MARRPLHFGLLLLLLCSEVLWATSSHNEDEVEDGVPLCPRGQYVVNGSCEPCPNGTYMDQPNSQTKCKPCDLQCGINEETISECTSSCNRQCGCKPGFCKNKFCPEACDHYSRCGNQTIKSQCDARYDSMCGNETGTGTMFIDSRNRGTREPLESMTGQHSEATPTSSTPTSSPPPTTATGSTGSGPLGWLIYLSAVFAMLVGTPLL